MHPLRVYRDGAQLTQLQLARRLGVSRTTVARWEGGMRRVELDLLQRITEATGIAGRDLRPDIADKLDPKHCEPVTEPAQA